MIAAVVTLLDAGHSRDGDPRRLYRVTIARETHRGITIELLHVDERYHGDEILNLVLDQYNIPTIAVTRTRPLGITALTYRNLAADAAIATSKFLEKAIS